MSLGDPAAASGVPREEARPSRDFARPLRDAAGPSGAALWGDAAGPSDELAGLWGDAIGRGEARAFVPLAPDLRMREVFGDGSGIQVLTGGQTGVDTAAALAGVRAGLVTQILFPRGWLQEDGPITAARRRALRGARLHELSLPEFAYRTWTCVYLCEAVVLIDPAGGEGCQQTVLAARSLGRPLLLADASIRPEQIIGWLAQTGARLLMVAGCRGSLLAAVGLRLQARRQAGLVVAGARQRQDQLQAAAG